MANLRSRQSKLIVLALAGAAFLLHSVRLLTLFVVAASAVAGTLAALGLLAEVPVVRRILRKLLRQIERRLGPCEETGP